MKNSWTKWIYAALTALALSACGGGGGGGGSVAGGTGGTGISSGQITGFGSIFVNGVEFECGSGTRIIDDDGTVDQGAGDRCVEGGLLAQGMVVSVDGSASGSSGNASHVHVRPALRGPVTAVDPASNTFTVLGQTIVVDDSTRFKINSGAPVVGPAGLASVNGQIVQVFGFPGPNNTIVATFVRTRVDASHSASEFEIKGIVSVSGGTVTLGTLTINLGSFTAPADGACVELKGSISGSILSLTRAPKTDDDCDGIRNSAGQAEVEGIVNELAGTDPNFTFKVGLQSVQTNSSTQYFNGTAADLLDGSKVEVEGPVSGGVMTAAKVKFKPGVRIEAKADSAGSSSGFSVLGIAVKTGAFTEFKDVANAAAIQANDCLRIRGIRTSGNTVNALRVEKRSSCSDTELRGPVDSGSIAKPAFKILGVQINTTTFTQFDEVNGATAQDGFFTALQANQLIKVKGSESPDNQIAAEEVETEED